MSNEKAAKHNNTLDIMEGLSLCHAQHEKGWLYFHELRSTTGYMADVRFFDGFAIHRYGSKAFESVGYEVKVTRADFLRDINNPEKQKTLLNTTNKFYFVTTADVCSAEDVPEWAGLLHFAYPEFGKPCTGDAKGLYKNYFKTVKPAPNRDRGETCSWGLAASLACSCVSNATSRALVEENRAQRAIDRKVD